MQKYSEQATEPSKHAEKKSYSIMQTQIYNTFVLMHWF